MYSIVSSFTVPRHVYGCDVCGKEGDGKQDEKNPGNVMPPIGYIIDCGPGLNPQQRLGIVCSPECRARLRAKYNVKTLDEQEAAEKEDAEREAAEAVA